MVCDEAQNIKNAGTRQARAVRGLPARSRLALTGTPVENHLGELWSIMEFTSPGLLGPAEKFRENFAVPVQRHGDEEAAARLKRLTGPFILRRVKTDRSIISDLPDKIEMKIWCTLTPEQASLYQATVTDMLARIDAAEADIERRGLVLATMAKLKQVCNHPAHLLGDGSRLPGRSGKLARLEEICEEIVAAGDKALCFTQYAEFGRVLQPYLAARLGCPVLYLHGGTAKNARDALVAEFQNAAEPAVFLLSLKAGGTGLNLTAASHVIHFDRWWNPAVEDQATDRAFRIGQRKDVQVRKFVCVGTLEERIDAMIEEKKALAERIVGTGEGWLTELSSADLREVLALSHRMTRRCRNERAEWRDALSTRRPGHLLVARGVRAAPGRERHQGPQQARRDRRAVVVPPVRRGAGVVRDEWPAGPRPELRPARPGHGVRAGHGQGPGPGAGFPARPLPGPDRGPAADHRAVALGHRGARRAGAVPGQAAGRGDAARDRGGVRGVRHPAVPPVRARPGDVLLLPGLGRAVQAPGRGLLRAGREVRRRPVRDAGLARPRPGGTARRAAAPVGRARPRSRWGDGPGRVFVARK